MQWFGFISGYLEKNDWYWLELYRMRLGFISTINNYGHANGKPATKRSLITLLTCTVAKSILSNPRNKMKDAHFHEGQSTPQNFANFLKDTTNKYATA